MYQIREVDGHRIINGHDIQVVGAGEKGLCRVMDGGGQEKYSGTYAECVQWLRDRAMLVK